jgi:hypothetical protein
VERSGRSRGNVRASLIQRNDFCGFGFTRDSVYSLGNRMKAKLDAIADTAALAAVNRVAM